MTLRPWLDRRAGSVAVAISVIGALVVLVPPGDAFAASKCQGKTATVVGSGKLAGTQGDDVIVGSPSKDQINGRGGSDTICGLGGADRITDGLGNDTVVGGGGADTFLQGSATDGADALIGSAGNDTVSYASRSVALDISLAEGSSPDGEPAEGDDVNTIERVVGGSAGDMLTGTDGNDVLTGGAGNDSLDALDGEDLLRGGQGDDYENGGLGSDTFDQEGLADGADTLDGGGFDPTGRHDVVDYSGRGNDVTVLAAQDNGEVGEGDTITGEIEDALLGSGDDTAVSSPLDNTFEGGPGNDNLSGGYGADVLAGGDGFDTLQPGSGIDSVSGEEGNDDLRLTSLTLDTLSVYATMSDFVAGTDRCSVDDSVFVIGDGDALLENALTRASSGGWGPSNELVVFTNNVTGSVTSASAVVAAAGAATVGVPTNRRALFVVDDGASSALWMFASDDGNASVASTELTLLAHLQDTPSTVFSDYGLIP